MGSCRRAERAQARHFGSHAVQLESQIRRHGDVGRQASAIAGRGEPQAEEALGGVDAGPGGAERASDKKMVGPAAKREAVLSTHNHFARAGAKRASHWELRVSAFMQGRRSSVISVAVASSTTQPMATP